MSIIQDAIKIGEVNFKDYRTEFFVMPAVNDYFESKLLSLATLIPEGWLWYESILSEAVENAKEEDPEADLGKGFKVIYTGISEDAPSDEDSEELNFNEMPEDAGEIIFGSSAQSVKNTDFHVKYIVLGK